MAGAPTYGSYWPLAGQRWDHLMLRANQAAEVTATARKLIGYKTRYQSIEKLTGVPWWLVAVLHERESGANFNTQLAQGDPLHQRSHNEPISGPFNTFEDSAVWALAHDHLNKAIDWRIEKALYFSELWNGWGYWMYHPSCPSPYVWGATSVQKAGKYIRDGVWSSSAWDTQIGTAAMLFEMAKLDPTIKFVRESPEGTKGDAAPPIPPPTPNGAKKTKAPPMVTRTGVPAASKGLFARFWAWVNS